MAESEPSNMPKQGPARIEMLDAIRGFALFGILLMNLEAFNGPILGAIGGIDSGLQGLDYWTDALIYIFVQGKFWTLFSLLFGIGFAVMVEGARVAGTDCPSVVVLGRRCPVVLRVGRVRTAGLVSFG